jgi:hypothetical protein
MHIDRVIDGVARYINGEIFGGLNDWQEVIARIAVGRILENKDALKQKIVHNPYIASFAVINADGEMDVEKFLADLKGAIAQKGSVTVSVPMFGDMKFVEADVDRLRGYIMNERIY